MFIFIRLSRYQFICTDHNCSQKYYVYAFPFSNISNTFCNSHTMTMLVFLSSTLLDFCWFLGWWVGVHWRCRLKFLLDCLCLLMAWWRVVLLYLLVMCQPSWWSKKEPHWYSHRSFTLNDFGMLSHHRGHSLTRHHRQTSIDFWRLMIRGCMPWCSGSCHPSPCCRRASWSFRRWWKQASD